MSALIRTHGAVVANPRIQTLLLVLCTFQYLGSQPSLGEYFVLTHQLCAFLLQKMRDDVYADAAQLAALGHKAELHRNFSPLYLRPGPMVSCYTS